MTPIPISRELFKHDVACALSLALLNAGRSMAARMAMIAITTSSSMSVNPTAELAFFFGISGFCISCGCTVFSTFAQDLPVKSSRLQIFANCDSLLLRFQRDFQTFLRRLDNQWRPGTHCQLP